MNIQHYFYLILRYLWAVILIVAAVLAGTWVWLGKQKPVYAATATLQVEYAADSVVDKIKEVQDGRLTGMDALNTEVQNIQSTDNLLAVADAIGRSAEWAASAPQGKVTPEMEAALAGSIKNQISVSLRRMTRLIDITAEAESPAKAAELAGKVAETFLKQKELGKTDSSRGASEFLIKEVVRLRDKLNESEKKVAQYRLDNNAVSLDDRQNIVVQRLNALSAQVTEANAKRSSLETDLAELKKVGENDVEGLLKLPSVAALPEVSLLRTNYGAKEAEFAALKLRYLELHPKFIAAQSELKELKNKLDQAVARAGAALRQEFDSMVENEAKLKDMLKAQEKLAIELDQVAIPYKMLQNEAASDRDMYQKLETRLKEVNVTQGLASDNFSLTGKALENPMPVRPQRTKTLLIAGLAALGACLGLIFLVDYLDASVRTVDEAESLFSLPVLAAVPEAKEEKLTGSGALVIDEPESPQAEAFRNLRASLSLLGEESKRRLFLVTSAIPSEGKTFSSTNLSASLASQGLRTLLIDADLRRPALSSNLLETSDRKNEEYRGLSDVLSGLCSPQDAVRATSIQNLSLLPSGRRAPNPGELLSQPSLQGLLNQFLEQYDRVVVDTAPVNAVSDALTIAPMCHAVCMVIRYGKTPRRAIQRAVTLLHKSGARLSGLVMNRMPLNRGAGYYYYYYGEGYGDSGKKKKRSK